MSITILDARGLSCPLPVLRANKMLKTLPPNGILRVQATDPSALKDIPAFCVQTGNELLAISTDSDGIHIFDIRRAT